VRRAATAAETAGSLIPSAVAAGSSPSPDGTFGGTTGQGPTAGSPTPGASGAPGSAVVRRFAVGHSAIGTIDGIADLDLIGLGALVDWAVPTLVLSVPGLLLLLAILAQLVGGVLWLPIARRWLGGFGLPRRGSRPDA
jgi:hypothetical protein